MKKFTKIFLVAAATLAMALSFTGCEDLLNAFVGQTGTISIVSAETGVSGTKSVTLYKYGMEPESTPAEYHMELTVDGSAKDCSDVLKASNYYKIKVGDTFVKATDNGVPTGYSSLTGTNDDGTMFTILGGYDYKIKLYKSGTGYIFMKKMSK